MAMEKLTFVVPTLLGVEGLTADELRRMGMAETRAETLPGGGEGHSPVKPSPSDRGTGLASGRQLSCPFV